MTDADVDGAHIRTLLLTFFYRQMTPLINRGYIYIAQPPLYKVKKNKKEMYLHTDDQLDKFLFAEGLDDVELYSLMNGKPAAQPFEPKKLSQIVQQLNELGIIVRKLERKELFWADYLTFRAQGRMPLFRIDDPALPEPRFIFSEKEKKEYHDEAIQKRDAEIKAAGELPLDGLNDEIDLHEKDLWELPKIDGLVKKLEASGVEMEHFGERAAKPVFRIKTKDDFYDLFSAKEVVEKVKEFGRKGASIQRYKGLGEMNPSQLWETTMDPVRRKFLQVRLDDAVEAESIFTKLMGDKVEPRRQFIEAHAADVTNLDI